MGALARAARALRHVERVFDAIERANAEAARRGELRIVALSERVGRDLEATFGLRPAAILRNGVELSRFGAGSAPRPGHAGSVRALFCAHALTLKGLDRALAALAHAPGATLTVVGRSGSAPWRKLAEPLGVADRVTWRGPVPDLAPLLAASDVLLYPSRYDPCSLVVLEALAAGVPVIASREDGSSELVGEGGFVLEDADDAREAGERLEALADPERRRSMSDAARARARSTDDVARELLALASPRAP
jgi:glycosyltransferase involved in cell wall biosynthesis